MFDRRCERIAAGAGNLFFLAAIILFITLILLTTGTVQAQDALEPDALDPDALEPDALGLDPGDIHDLFVPIGETDRIPWVFCYKCQEWFDLSVNHSHKAWYPWWLWSWYHGRYDVPNHYWWSFGEGFVDEYGAGTGYMKAVPPRPNMLPGPAGPRQGVTAVPALVAGKAPEAGSKEEQRKAMTLTERSRSVPAVVERSPGRAQGRVKR